MPKTTLEPETMLELFYKFGSLQKVANYLDSKGVVSPRTGKPFTRSAIHYAMCRTEEYRKIVNKRHKIELANMQKIKSLDAKATANG